jgi:hypothetical protein
VQLEVHVNRAHLDDLSPAVQPVSSSSSSEHACPLCPVRFSGVAALQSHFTAAHAADLSPPQKTSRGSRGPFTPSSAHDSLIVGADRNGNCDADNSACNSCPVCGKQFFSEDSNRLLARHVDAHFSASSSSSSPASANHQDDLLLAQEIQRREQEAERWREEQEFAALQAVLWNRNRRNRNFWTNGTGTVIIYGSGTGTRYKIMYLISFT